MTETQRNQIWEKWIDFASIHSSMIGQLDYSELSKISKFWINLIEELTIEHCDEPECPECNIAAYTAGRVAERTELLQEIEDKIKSIEQESKDCDCDPMPSILAYQGLISYLKNKK